MSYASLTDEYDYEEPEVDLAGHDSDEAELAPYVHEADEDEQYENAKAETFVEAAEIGAHALNAEPIGEEALFDPNSAADLMQAHALLAQEKGKGKGAGKSLYPVRPSHLSVQDRRAKFANLKRRTECKYCGRPGHWSSDPEYPAKKGSASSSGSGTKTAHTSARRQFRIKGEHDPDIETSAFVAPDIVPVTPKPWGSTQYVGMTCDEEITATVSDATPDIEFTQFSSGVCRGMTFQKAFSSFPNEYQMWSKLEKPPKEIAMCVFCGPRTFSQPRSRRLDQSRTMMSQAPRCS